MIKSKVRYSPEAVNDLDEIWAYIADELQNVDGAVNTVDGIMDAVDKLNDFPEMGPLLSSITNTESVFRFLVCGSYNAFYHLDGNVVSVDRVLYGKRDYMQVLFEIE